MLALSLALAPSSAGGDGSRGVAVAGNSTGPAVPFQYSSSHALVIGMDAYRSGWSTLKSAVSDAREMARSLRALGFKVTLRTDLTGDELQKELRRFFAAEGQDPRGRLLVWYAGHGHTIRGEGYLVPVDAPSAERTADFFQKALPMRDFGTLMRMAQTRHVLAVFDSCFSGTIFAARGGADATPVVSAAMGQPVRQFLTAGDEKQRVRDDGSFRQLFLRAIRGEEDADTNDDGFVTGIELGLFLRQRVISLTGGAQTPKFGPLLDVGYDQGDIVFELPPESAAARPARPSGPPRGTLRVEAGSEGRQVFVGTTPAGVTDARGRLELDLPVGSFAVTLGPSTTGGGLVSAEVSIRPDASTRIGLDGMHPDPGNDDPSPPWVKGGCQPPADLPGGKCIVGVSSPLALDPVTGRLEAMARALAEASTGETGMDISHSQFGDESKSVAKSTQHLFYRPHVLDAWSDAGTHWVALALDAASDRPKAAMPSEASVPGSGDTVAWGAEGVDLEASAELAALVGGLAELAMGAGVEVKGMTTSYEQSMKEKTLEYQARNVSTSLVKVRLGSGAAAVDVRLMLKRYDGTQLVDGRDSAESMHTCTVAVRLGIEESSPFVGFYSEHVAGTNQVHRAQILTPPPGRTPSQVLPELRTLLLQAGVRISTEHLLPQRGVPQVRVTVRGTAARVAAAQE